jgi:hypothetical protein
MFALAVNESKPIGEPARMPGILQDQLHGGLAFEIIHDPT